MIELSGGEAGDIGDVVMVGQGHPSEGFPTEDPSPAFEEVQPGRPHGNECLLNARHPTAELAALLAHITQSRPLEAPT